MLTFQQTAFLAKPPEFEASDISHPPTSQCTHRTHLHPSPLVKVAGADLWAAGVLGLV